MLKRLVIACFVAINILSLGFLTTHYSKMSLWKMLLRRSQTETEIAKNIDGNRSPPWKGILIQTNFRSGSSFFGELFNQRDDVYYSYEPLIGLNDESEVLDLLNSTFSCKIWDASHIRPSQDRSLSNVLKLCKYHNVCFRHRMKNLCSKRFCKLPSSCQRCKKPTSFDMSRICSTKQLTVAKVIRLARLDSIKALMNDKRLDLKVIHLVRDPRGMLASRMKLTKAEGMKSTCKNMLRNVNLGLFHTPEWLRGRYKLIRYEDLAMYPQGIARDVYNYADLEMTQEMQRWISVNTMGRVMLTTDPKAQQLLRARRIPVKAFQKSVLSNAYTTIRHSNTTWWSWTTSLRQPAIEKVQQDCKELMNLLGYGIVTSFHNITSNDILLIPPPYKNLMSKNVTIDVG